MTRVRLTAVHSLHATAYAGELDMTISVDGPGGPRDRILFHFNPDDPYGLAPDVASELASPQLSSSAYEPVPYEPPPVDP